MFETVTGEIVEPAVAVRFYPRISAGIGTLVWIMRRRLTHDELVRAWTARKLAGPAETARLVAADHRGASGGTPQGCLCRARQGYASGPRGVTSPAG